METLGSKLKQLRKNLTQDEVANILQVDRSTLASWETNRREPDIATLCRIADYFHISIDWLVGRIPAKASTQPPRIQENPAVYQPDTDEAWTTVIAFARTHGLKPEQVKQLIELNVQIALTLNEQ